MTVPLSRLEASKSAVPLLLLLVATGLFAAAAVLGPRYVAELRVLSQTSIPPEGKDGRVRSFATFHPEGAMPVPPCLVRWKSGKNSSYAHISGDNRVELSNGRKLIFSGSQTLEFFLNTAPYRPRIQDATHALSEKYWKAIFPGRAYQEKSCLSESEIIWLDACVKGNQLVACEDKDAVFINPGGPKRYSRYVMCRAHGSIGFGMLGAVFIVLALNARFRVSRRVLEDLARWRNIMSGEAAAVVAIILSIGTFISITLWGTEFGPWFSVAGAIGLVLASLVATIMRLRVIGAARRLLREMQTSRLHSNAAGTRELAVRIAPDAPLIAGLRSNEQHAIIQFQIKEFYKEQNGGKTVNKMHDVAQGSFPRHVPIVDASGPATLDTAHCILDAEPEIVVRYAELNWHPGLIQTLGQIPRAPTHDEYVVHYRVAQPGDPLLIYGGIERVRADIVGAQVSAQYRQTPDVPLVRGSAAAPALVHVGDEVTLMSGVNIERIARVAGIVVLITALVIGVAAIPWVIQQAP